MKSSEPNHEGDRIILCKLVGIISNSIESRMTYFTA